MLLLTTVKVAVFLGIQFLTLPILNYSAYFKFPYIESHTEGLYNVCFIFMHAEHWEFVPQKCPLYSIFNISDMQSSMSDFPIGQKLCLIYGKKIGLNGKKLGNFRPLSSLEGYLNLLSFFK